MQLVRLTAWPEPTRRREVGRVVVDGELVRLTAPLKLGIAPPNSAELPERVLSVIVSVPPV